MTRGWKVIPSSLAAFCLSFAETNFLRLKEERTEVHSTQNIGNFLPDHRISMPIEAHVHSHIRKIINYHKQQGIGIIIKKDK
jgi:hypothetical protein